MQSTTVLSFFSQPPVGRPWLSWVLSAISGLGVTLILFSVVPGLLHPDVLPATTCPPAAPVNVIRMPRPDPPAVRDTPRKPPVAPPKASLIPQTAPRQLPRTDLRLPFDINPKLTDGPVSLVMPPMASASSAGLGSLGLPDVVETAALDQPLVTLSRIPPAYPMAAKRMGIHGWVKVRFMVTQKGKVDRVTIVDAHPPEVFNTSVASCVSRWRFKPGTVEGVPVNCWAETTVTFQLKS